MAVIDISSSAPTIVTALLFFFARVVLPHWTIFNGVWSKLIIRKSGMACFSTFETISYRKRYSIFFGADSGKSTLVELFRRQENPIRNKLSAQYEESSLMSPTTFGYFLISALAAVLAMDQVIAAPRLLIPSMYFWTIESNFSKSKGRPVFERAVEDFFSLLPEVAFHTFFGTSLQYFLWCLGIASENCGRLPYFHARRHIFQWNTGSRWSIWCTLQTLGNLFLALLKNQYHQAWCYSIQLPKLKKKQEIKSSMRILFKESQVLSQFTHWST